MGGVAELLLLRKHFPPHRPRQAVQEAPSGSVRLAIDARVKRAPPPLRNKALRNHVGGLCVVHGELVDWGGLHAASDRLSRRQDPPAYFKEA